MNAAQSRALVAMWERIADLRRQPVDELCLGDGARIIGIDSVTDTAIDRLVGEEGWQGVTVWEGGLGLELLVDNAGTVYCDPWEDDDDAKPEPVDLYLTEDGRLDWVVKEAEANG